jgi:aryl-alcohol dehydrogenase-like predicted oxidoreductase
MHYPVVTVAITGAKLTAQLSENMTAALLPPLTEEEMHLIDPITPPGGGLKIWPV